MTAEYRRVYDPAEIVGKTVARMCVSSNEEFFFVMDDNTYLCVSYWYCEGDNYAELDRRLRHSSKVEAGVATAEEIARNAKEVEWQEARKEQDERQQYERLKAKYEGGRA